MPTKINGGGRHSPDGYGPEVKAEILRLWNIRGLTAQRIALRVGVSKSFVWKVIRESRENIG